MLDNGCLGNTFGPPYKNALMHPIIIKFKEGLVVHNVYIETAKLPIKYNLWVNFHLDFIRLK